MKKIKKEKKKKLDSIPKINRKLFKLWSIAVREKALGKCEFCGKMKGEDNECGNINKIDSHHILSRNIKDCPLKFDIRNGVAVDPAHHKFSIPSFHRDPVTTITWLQKHRPSDYEFILNNSKVTVDLQNRAVLAEIEQRLIAKESLDLEKLKQIAIDNPKEIKPPKIPKSNTIFSGSLFDDECSSSSSSS